MVSWLKVGTKIESEHKPTYRFLKGYVKTHGKLPPEKLLYRHIAINHLSERKDYYKRLKGCNL